MNVKSELRLSLFIILVIAAGIGIGIACTWVVLEQEREYTKKLVDSEAKHYLSFANKDEEYEGKQDAWGRPLEYEGSVEEDRIIVSVRSAGPDGSFDTSDDIVSVRQDLNKSKLVGKWAGKRIKEAGSGLWQGLKSKSDFKK